jgi:hypothetical protein
MTFAELVQEHRRAQDRSLPRPLTSFVGRKRELGQLEQLLVGSRLLTLTGPGGRGKTRLALRPATAVAECFEDGVVFVPLASVFEPSLVPQKRDEPSARSRARAREASRRLSPAATRAANAASPEASASTAQAQRGASEPHVRLPPFWCTAWSSQAPD